MRSSLLLSAAALLLAAASAACTASPSAPRGPASVEAKAPPPVASSEVAVASVVVPLPADLALDADAQAAVQTLANADAFGGEAVGYSGEPVPAVAALRQLLARADANRVLQLVVEHGTLAGQLLALCGLYRVDPVAFQTEVAAYRGMATPVRVNLGGCGEEIQIMPVSTLVEAPGAMQLAHPKESLADWSRRHPGNHSLVLDLLGGGYPLVIVGS